MAELLNDTEKRMIAIAGELANLFHQIIPGTAYGGRDVDEFVFHVHAIQRMIGAQAAARAYPDLYRRLGREIGE